MHKTIISNTSCIILLDKIDELEILNKLFRTIITTQEVAEEFGQQLPSWFEIQQPKDKTYQTIIETSVDNHHAEKIDIINIADESYFSKFHFMRLFKNIYGNC